MTSAPFYHRIHPADGQLQHTATRRDQVGGKDPQPLNPAVSFSVIALVSLRLWWGIWESVSFFLFAAL